MIKKGQITRNNLENFELKPKAKFCEQEYKTYSSLPPRFSAFRILTYPQKIFLSFIFFSALFILFFDVLVFLKFFFGILTIFYCLDLVFSFLVIQRGLSKVSNSVSKKDLDKINIQELPVYTILCPLYKESKVIDQLLQAIGRLDWPKDKLEVLFLLEEDDEETKEALKEKVIPSYIRVLYVPKSLPKTKPKALNYGLSFARGKYLVVYDAEDKPDPLQLKKAFIQFSKVNENVACLQAKLNYYNRRQNILTRLFSAEYSLWFDLILPGLQSFATVIPLGGTSNHFKTEILKKVGGWDAFNVTEDCDLGVRLFRLGYQTLILPSTTYEEASSTLVGWIRQRSRWLKGYFQTYFVHTRDPINFIREKGVHAFLFHLTIGLRATFVLVNPLLWMQTISYFLFRSKIGALIEEIYPSPIFYFALFALIFGNFFYFYSYMIASAKKGLWDNIPYVFFVPFYWLFISLSALIALYQLVSKPYFWEKTTHGFHLTQDFADLLVDPLGLFDFKTLIRKRFLPAIKTAFVVLKRTFYDLVQLIEPIDEKRGRNILFFNWRDIGHFASGGAEVYIHEIAKRLVKRGWNVTVFSSWDGISSRNQKIDGVNIIRRGGFFTVYFWAFIYYLVKFRKWVDIVFDSANGLPFFTPVYVSKPKVLIFYHIHQELFSKYLPKPISTVCCLIEKKLLPFFYKNVLILTISTSSKADILENILVGTREGVEVINPGVSSQLFEKNGFEKEKYPLLVYLGRLKPWKNIDLAIRAFANLSQKYQEARFIIAGWGEFRDYLENLVKELNLAGKVIFLGKVSEEEKISLLTRAWVSIQPSSLEGWGITVIESNACGTPVIAANVRGLKDSIIDGRTGILFDDKDKVKLYQAMRMIIEDRSLRQFLSEEAYLWSRGFSWELSVDKFENLIQRVIREEKFLPLQTQALIESV